MDDGFPKLQVFKTLVNFQKEIGKYHNASVVINGERVLTDKPVQKNDHLMSDFRYIAMYDPQYVQPLPAVKPHSKAYLAWLHSNESIERMGMGEGLSSVSLGPPGG